MPLLKNSPIQGVLWRSVRAAQVQGLFGAVFEPHKCRDASEQWLNQTNACSTVEERRFSAALAEDKTEGFSPRGRFSSWLSETISGG